MTIAKTSIFEVAPNHSTVRQRLSLGEGSAQRPGLCFPFGGPKVSEAQGTIHFAEKSTFATFEANYENLRKQDCPYYWR